MLSPSDTSKEMNDGVPSYPHHANETLTESDTQHKSVNSVQEQFLGNEAVDSNKTVVDNSVTGKSDELLDEDNVEDDNDELGNLVISTDCASPEMQEVDESTNKVEMEQNNTLSNTNSMNEAVFADGDEMNDALSLESAFTETKDKHSSNDNATECEKNKMEPIAKQVLSPDVEKNTVDANMSTRTSFLSALNLSAANEKNIMQDVTTHGLQEQRKGDETETKNQMEIQSKSQNDIHNKYNQRGGFKKEIKRSYLCDTSNDCNGEPLKSQMLCVTKDADSEVLILDCQMSETVIKSCTVRGNQNAEEINAKSEGKQDSSFEDGVTTINTDLAAQETKQLLSDKSEEVCVKNAEDKPKDISVLKEDKETSR